MTSVSSEHVSWKAGLAFFVICLAFVGTILAIGFQNIAAATPEQVNFNPVTIRNGAKIHVNGDKSLTAIDNGSKLVADNTNGTPVKGDQIESELNSFAATNYGDDALFKSGVASNPASLSEAEINAFSHYLPAAGGDYWLSDISTRYGFRLISVVNKNNKLIEIYKNVSGRGVYPNSFSNVELNFNNRDLAQNYNMDSFTQASNSYLYYLNPTGTVELNTRWIRGAEGSSQGILRKGDSVWNNPYLIEDNSIGFYKSTFTSDEFMTICLGKVVVQDGVFSCIPFKKGDSIRSGDTLFMASRSISDQNPNHFLKSSKSEPLIFFRSRGDFSVGNVYMSVSVLGLYNYSYLETIIKGSTLVGGEYFVRPAYDYDINDVAFFRNSYDSSNLLINKELSNGIIASVSFKDSVKSVLRSYDVNIVNHLSANKIRTEKSTNNHTVTKYTNGVIQVPYGAKTLTINSSAFNTANANYISALANVNGTQKYAVLGQTGENLEIDLASIVNNNQVGSKATVSFYAEQANPANSSDVISETPVTVEIEVVEGTDQTIRYDLGGGTGNLPSNATIKAGKSYSMADGSGLNKNGNLFSRWELTYTPYGETDEVSSLIKANEAIVVPDAANGTITATAMYSGVSSMKSTDSKSSVVTVTWDSNAPEGTTATFTDSTGSYNDDKSIRYDKIKVAGSSVVVPGAPSLSTTTRIFDGWYDAKEGGNKVTGSVNPSVNTTYYARWIDGYRVTYDATGGQGAKITGKFVLDDGSSLGSLDETVFPRSKIQGPTVGGSTVSPIANIDDSSGVMFVGWYPQPNGPLAIEDEAIIGSTEIDSDVIYYAYYEYPTFMAKTSTASGFPDPRKIAGEKYSLDYVTKAARDIASNGTSSSYYNQFKTWLNEDNGSNDNTSYHLYTLKQYNGSWYDTSKADNWNEFRIVHVGQHNSDGSGLTFQSVHLWEQYGIINSTYTNTGGWAGSLLYSNMNSTNGGFNILFDPKLKNTWCSLASPSNKGKLWISSITEMFGNQGLSSFKSGVSSDGDQYDFWRDKTVTFNDDEGTPENRITILISRKRSGDYVTRPSSTSKIESFCLRTPTPTRSWSRVTISSSLIDNYRFNGCLSSYDGYSPIGIVACFAM